VTLAAPESVTALGGSAVVPAERRGRSGDSAGLMQHQNRYPIFIGGEKLTAARSLRQSAFTDSPTGDSGWLRLIVPPVLNVTFMAKIL